jgi:AcrR family transcriptional regulator
LPASSPSLASGAIDPPPSKLGQCLGAKGARTRRRIMDATAELIAQRSFADVRITDIARIAQIAQPNFYTYFSGVEEVVKALAEEVSLDGLARLLEPDWSGPGGLDLSRQLVEEALALWEAQRAVLGLTWFLADKRQGDFPTLRVRQVRGLYKALERQIRQSQAAGRLARGVQPRLAGYECVGLISSAAANHSLLLESGFTRKQLVETNARLVHMIVTGISTPAEPDQLRNR